MYCSMESEEVGKSLSCVDGVDGVVGQFCVCALSRSCCNVGVSVWVLWGVRVCKCCCEVVMVFGGSVVGVVSSWGGVCVIVGGVRAPVTGWSAGVYGSRCSVLVVVIATGLSGPPLV